MVQVGHDVDQEGLQVGCTLVAEQSLDVDSRNYDLELAAVGGRLGEPRSRPARSAAWTSRAGAPPPTANPSASAANSPAGWTSYSPAPTQPSSPGSYRYATRSCRWPTHRTALGWLHRSNGAALLGRLARGELPLTHGSLDEASGNNAQRMSIEHLRRMLVAAGALPERDETLCRVQTTATKLIAELGRPDDKRILRAFATCHILAGLRSDNRRHPITPLTGFRARSYGGSRGHRVRAFEAPRVAPNAPSSATTCVSRA